MVIWRSSCSWQTRVTIDVMIKRIPTLPRILARHGYVCLQTGKHWEGDYKTAGFTDGMTLAKPSTRLSQITGTRKQAGGDWVAHGNGDGGLTIGRETMKPIDDFVARHSAKRPFMVWYAPFLPHTPFDAPKRFHDLYSGNRIAAHLRPYTRTAKSIRRHGAPRSAGVYGLTKVLDANRIEINPAAKADEELVYSVGTHHYYDWRIANCHFFALDTRGERSIRNPNDRKDPKLFVLGAAQKRWLLEGMRKTDAQFIFLISPDPWMIYHTAAHVGGSDEDDKGDGFPSFLREREELLTFFDKLDKPVLIFTGDVHASASVKITDNVWEMMCGPLGSTGHPLGTLGNPPKGGKFDSKGREVEFRWVTGFPNNLPYQKIRNTYYAIVQVNNVLRVAAPQGLGYQWVAYDTPQVVVRWHDGYTGKLAYAESITTLDAKK